MGHDAQDSEKAPLAGQRGSFPMELKLGVDLSTAKSIAWESHREFKVGISLKNTSSLGRILHLDRRRISICRDCDYACGLLRVPG